MNKIYLDYNATTPVHPIVKEAMLPFFDSFYANPSNRAHEAGIKCRSKVEESRSQIAQFLNAPSSSIYFTSGATESNNLALFGSWLAREGQKSHIITAKTEHSSVLTTLKFLESQGVEVTYLQVNAEGQIDLNELKDSIRPDTYMVAVMYANNEIGTYQNVEEIGDFLKDNSVLFHCDCAQAYGYNSINIEKLKCDTLSLSGHKIYGPKGVGLLYINRTKIANPIKPLFYGGGQESAIRPGTLNVPGIVGFASASQWTEETRKERCKKAENLTQKLKSGLSKIFPNLKFHGHPKLSLPSTTNVCLPGYKHEVLLSHLGGTLEMSTGSACSSLPGNYSHVLKAIGVKEDEAKCTYRMGVGEFTTDRDIDMALNLFESAKNRIKTPVYTL